MLPPEINSTKSVITKPIPVSVTTPTTVPAAAVATPIPIMLRAPETKLSNRSTKPALVCSARSSDLFIRVIKGRCVIKMKIMNTVAQKAERPGENRSTVRHQTSTTIGNRKCKPDLMVGPGSGTSVSSASMSIPPSAAYFAETRTKAT